MKHATIKDAPAVLNTNDKAMWVLGYNAALQQQPEPVAFYCDKRDLHHQQKCQQQCAMCADCQGNTTSPDLLQMLHECAEYIAALNGEQDDYCQRARALIARATGASS